MAGRVLALIPIFCLFVAPSAQAQRPDPFSELGRPGAPTTIATRGAALILTVFKDAKAHLDRQAVVKISNLATQDVYWQTTQDQAEAAFGDLSVGRYDIEASAVGYLTEHKELLVGSAIGVYHLEMTLKPDPTAVDLNAAITADLAPKARKETQRGVTALKSGDYKQAQKRLESAYKIAPHSADVNFLLGYLYFQRKDLEQAKTYLGNASAIDPHNVQALTLLGRIRLQQNDYSGARSALEQATSANRDYWPAHSLLANAYLKQHEFDKAREQAQVAIKESKGGGNMDRLTLGQALANLGKNEEALQSLDTFLQNAPGSPLEPQVRELIAHVEKQTRNPTAASEPSPTILGVADAESPESDDFRLSIKTWEPPDIDEVKPGVASGVSCPLDTVIEQTGQRAKELVDNIARFQAIEELLHESVDELGRPITKQSRQFNYLAEISESQPGWMAVNEYRYGASGLADFPDKIVTRGLPALALIFHPAIRDTFHFTCEGLGDWHGQATWLVYFRQRDDKPNKIRAYKVGADLYSIDLKGRARIAADKFNVVHIDSELVKPMRKIQLLSEHQSVDYGPVSFPKKSMSLWLPKSAELYFDFRRHRYHRRDSFDHFMLFSVESEENRKEPPASPIQNN